MALTLRDAFIVPLYCGEIGIPMFAMQMVNSLGTVEGELAARVAAQRDVYRGNGSRVSEQIVEIERILVANKLAVPARPNTFAEYMQWSDAACKAVADATGPEAPEGAIAAFGRALGDMLQAVAVAIAVLDLRARAPEHETLRTYDAQTGERLATCLRRLEGVSTFSTLPAVARPFAEKLASFARMATALDPAQRDARKAGLELVFAKLAENTRDLTAALSS
jgi:hypothetical protein